MNKYQDHQKRRFSKLCKNSRQGKICGVFSGLGDYLGINPLILRVIGIVALLMMGPMMILAYLLVAVLLDDNPYGLHHKYK